MESLVSVPTTTGQRASINALAIKFYERVDFHPTRTAEEEFPEALGKYAPCQAPQNSAKDPYARETWVYVFRKDARGRTTLRAEIQYDKNGKSKMVDWREMNRWIREGKPKGGGPSWKGTDARPADVEQETFLFPWDQSDGESGWTYYAMLSSVQLPWARIEEYRTDEMLLQQRATELTPEDPSILQVPDGSDEPAKALLTDWLGYADQIHAWYQRAVEAKRSYEARYAPEALHYRLTRRAKQAYEEHEGESLSALDERLDAFSTVKPGSSPGAEGRSPSGSGVYDRDCSSLQDVIDRRGDMLYREGGILEMDPYRLAREDAVAVGAEPPDYTDDQAERVAQECVRQGSLLADAEACADGQAYLERHFGPNFDNADNWYKKYAFHQKVLKRVLEAGSKGMKNLVGNMEAEHAGELSGEQWRQGRALEAQVHYAKALQIGAQADEGSEVPASAEQLTQLLEHWASESPDASSSLQTGTRLVGPNADVSVPSPTGDAPFLTVDELFGGGGTVSEGTISSSADLEPPSDVATSQTGDGLQVLPVDGPGDTGVTQLRFTKNESGLYVAQDGGILARGVPDGWSPNNGVTRGELTPYQQNVVRRQTLMSKAMQNTDLHAAAEQGEAWAMDRLGRGSADLPDTSGAPTPLGMFGRALAGLDALSVWTETAAFDARLTRGKPEDMSTMAYWFLAGGDLAGAGAGAAGVVSSLEYSQAARSLVAKRLGAKAAFKVAGQAAAFLALLASLSDFAQAYINDSEFGMASAVAGFASAGALGYGMVTSSGSLGTTGWIGLVLGAIALILSYLKDSPLGEWFEDCYWNVEEGPYSRSRISDTVQFITSVADGSWPEEDRYDVPAERLSSELDDLLKIAARPSLEVGFWNPDSRPVFFTGSTGGTQYSHDLPKWLRVEIRPGLLPKDGRLHLDSFTLYHDGWLSDSTCLRLESPLNPKEDPRVLTIQTVSGGAYLLHANLSTALSEKQKQSFSESDPGNFGFEAELSVHVENETAQGIETELDQKYHAEGGLIYRMQTSLTDSEERVLVEPAAQIEPVN